MSTVELKRSLPIKTQSHHNRRDNRTDPLTRLALSRVHTSPSLILSRPNIELGNPENGRMDVILNHSKFETIYLTII